MTLTYLAVNFQIVVAETISRSDSLAFSGFPSRSQDSTLNLILSLIVDFRKCEWNSKTHYE